MVRLTTLVAIQNLRVKLIWWALKGNIKETMV